jgi:hypothetical protein
VADGRRVKSRSIIKRVKSRNQQPMQIIKSRKQKTYGKKQKSRQSSYGEKKKSKRVSTTEPNVLPESSIEESNNDTSGSGDCDDDCPTVTPTPCPKLSCDSCPKTPCEPTPCPICSGVPCPPCPACPPCAATLDVAVDTEARYLEKSNVILAETRTELDNISNLESDTNSFNDKDKLLLLLSRIKESDKKVSENIKLLIEIALIFNKTVAISYDSARYNQVWEKVVTKLKNLYNVTPPPALRLPAPTAVATTIVAAAPTPIPVESVTVVDIVTMTSSTNVQDKFSALCTANGIDTLTLDPKYQKIYKSLLDLKKENKISNPELDLFKKIRDELQLPKLDDEAILKMFPDPIKKTIPLPEPSLPSFELPITREKTKNELLQEQLDKVSERLGNIPKLEVTDAMVGTLEEIKKDQTLKNKYFEFFKKIRNELNITDKLSDAVILDLFPNEAITIDIRYAVVLPTKINEGSENDFVSTSKILKTNINDTLSSLKNNKLETLDDYKDINTNLDTLEQFRKFYFNVLNSLVTFTDKKITKYKIKSDEEIVALNNVKNNHMTFARWLYKFLNDNSIIRPIDSTPKTTDGAGSEEDAPTPMVKKALGGFLDLIAGPKKLNTTAVVVVIEEPSSQKIINSIKYIESLLADLTLKRKPYDIKVAAITAFHKNMNEYNTAVTYYKKTLVSYDSYMQEMQNQVSLIEYYNHESFLYLYKVREVLEKRKKLTVKDILQFLDENAEIKNQIKNRWEYLRQRDTNTKNKLFDFGIYDITNTSSPLYTFIKDFNLEHQKHLEILSKKNQDIKPNDSIYLQTLKENLKLAGIVTEKNNNTSYTVTQDKHEYTIPTSAEIEFIYDDWNAVDTTGNIIIDDATIRTKLNSLKPIPKWKFLQDMIKQSPADQPLDRAKLQMMARSHAPLHPKTYPITVGSQLLYFEYIVSDYFNKSIKQEEKFENIPTTLSALSEKLFSLVKPLMANFLSVEKKNKIDTYNHKSIIINCFDFLNVLSSNEKLLEFFNTPLTPPETT